MRIMPTCPGGEVSVNQRLSSGSMARKRGTTLGPRGTTVNDPVVWFMPTSWLLAGSEAQTRPFQRTTPQISERSKQRESGVELGKGHGYSTSVPLRGKR